VSEYEIPQIYGVKQLADNPLGSDTRQLALRKCIDRPESLRRSQPVNANRRDTEAAQTFSD
jgi:hypothetical protein